MEREHIIMPFYTSKANIPFRFLVNSSTISENSWGLDELSMPIKVNSSLNTCALWMWEDFSQYVHAPCHS